MSPADDFFGRVRKTSANETSCNTAHYLMNQLVFLNEPLDTAVVKVNTAPGVDAFIAVTHASDPDKKQNPCFVYEYATLVGVGMHFPRLRGVAYKKYFLPRNGASLYTVPCDGDTYVYMDFLRMNPKL